ncbi:MAG: hypothetical protein JWN75_1214 [Candidatus Saccharibacteria bacterium]|nr:hypothetical protein [Candidatus Saccharibacteria bacterium]MDB5716411.1 hypothetical protein [Sphingomonadales bacterium]
MKRPLSKKMKAKVDTAVDAILAEFNMSRTAFFDDEPRDNYHVAPLTKIIREALK